MHIERFSGLNLRDDPAEVGVAAALDVLNVDFDRAGRIRSRGGYENWTDVSVAGTFRAFGFFDHNNIPELIAATAGTIYAYAADGQSNGSTTCAVGAGNMGIAAGGTPTTSYVYASNGTTNVKRWDGSSWTTPAGMPTGLYLANWSAESRLVSAGNATNRSRVSFSDRGAPETWGANDYQDVSPNDGVIVGMVASGQNLFVFKYRTLFVFYGSRTDSAGDTEYLYRTYTLPSEMWGSSISGTAACAGNGGVYYVAQDGIYFTTGGPPQKVSGIVDGLFMGGYGATYLTAGGIQEPLQLAFADNRLYLTADHSSALYTHVFDLESQAWSIWDIAARAVIGSSVGGSFALYFALPNYVVKQVPSLTDDAGAAITSLYRSGFSDLGFPGQEKTIRQAELTGQGTVQLGYCRDFDDITSSSQANVTMGTAPAVDRGYHRKAQRGELLGWKLASVTGGAWQLNRATLFLRGVRAPAENTD